MEVRERDGGREGGKERKGNRDGEREGEKGRGEVGGKRILLLMLFLFFSLSD